MFEYPNEDSFCENSNWGERGKEPAAAAVGCSLSYHDSDVGNPLPAFTPRREPGFHLGIPKPQKYIGESSGLFSIIFYACVRG